MATPIRVLILEDRLADAELMVHELRRAGFDPDWQRVESEPDYLASLALTPDIILADYTLPNFDAPRALQQLQERGLDIPFIVVTGAIGDEAAADCVKRGATDYLLKDRLARLGPAVVQALEQARLRDSRRGAEANLRESEERFRLMADDAPVMIWMSGPDGFRTFVNQGWLNFTGHTPEEEQGQGWTKGMHTDDLRRHVDAFQAAFRDRQPFRVEYRLRRHDGEYRWILDTSIPRFTPDGSFGGYIGSAIDITERKQIEERLRYLAMHDPLTTLPNRELFQDRLDQALARSQRSGGIVAVMMLDLDHFKRINDTLGHARGDLVLKAVAERLKGCVRKNDTVARLAGDEFTFVFEGLSDAQGCFIVARKILNVLAEPFVLDDREFLITASIGISLYPTHGEDVESLLKTADIAMYDAKEKTNGYRVYNTTEPENGIADCGMLK
jgi:diguanylate cyclase (GGDEF)-like protein/PAS domain S-box-containing protein